MIRTVILDSGALISLAEKATHAQRELWLTVLSKEEISCFVPPVVATEFIRGARSTVSANWWLSNFGTLATTFDDGKRAGALLRMARDRAVSVADAHVVHYAVTKGAGVLTTDPRDIQKLVDAAGLRIPIFRPPWPI